MHNKLPSKRSVEVNQNSTKTNLCDILTATWCQFHF